MSNSFLNKDFSDLVELLQYRAAYEPDKTACIFLKDGEQEEGSLTYRQLDIHARSIASRLLAAGAKGERALLIYPPGLEYIAGFFGCLYAGVIAVPAYPPHPARLERTMPRLTAIIQNAKPVMLMTTSSLISEVSESLINTAFRTFKPGLKKLLKKILHSVSMKVLHNDILRKFLFFKYREFGEMQWFSTDDIPCEYASEWNKPSLNQDSLAFLQYTSGSTGTPKGVMVSHGNLLYNSAIISMCFETKPDDAGVIWLPPYHDMGLIGGILQPIYNGFPVILMSPVAFLQKPFRWLQAISRYKATISGGPNFAYDLCVRKTTPEQKAELDLSSWNVAFNGSEPIRPDTLDRFSDAFSPCGFRRQAFYPCYGLAEGTLIVSGGSVNDEPVLLDIEVEALKNNKVVTNLGGEFYTLVGCGKNLNGQQILIVNSDTFKQCYPDEIGEIWVSGKSVACGYWKRAEETKATFQNSPSLFQNSPPLPPAPPPPQKGVSFLRTGDLGFLHNGELFVTGRLKDLIIIRGRNHYPQDIELTVEKSYPRLRPGCSAAFEVEIEGENRLVVAVEVERRFGERRYYKQEESKYSSAERRRLLRRYHTELPDYNNLKGTEPLDIKEAVEAIRKAVSEQHELQVYGVLLLRVGSIPKTSSGKIQRHACKQAFLNGTLDIVGKSINSPSNPPLSPRRGDDRKGKLSPPFGGIKGGELVTLISSVMKIDPSELNPDKPLTALGIDSMMAIELSHSIETELGVILPVTRFLEGVTIRQLKEEIDSLAQKKETIPSSYPQKPVSKVAADSGFSRNDDETVNEDFFSPLSYNQKSLWFMQCLAPDSTAYNVCFAVRIRSKPDIKVLQNAFQNIVERHPCLRTTYTMQNNLPVQHIHSEAGNFFEIIDASEWNDQEIYTRLINESRRPFDLEKGPVIRVTNIIRKPEDHILMLNIHHIATDLWSFSLMLDELGKYQEGDFFNEQASYINYIKWQTELLSGHEGERLWNYWKNKLSGELPILNLPTDFPRPAVQTYRGNAHNFEINKALAQKLKELAQSSNTTLFVTLLAAFQVLLYRYTGQEDILTGSPAAGRTKSEFARVLGYFVNPVVIRSDLSGNPAFSAFLNQVRHTVLDVLAHQDYPFQLLVERLQPERDPGHSPVFQVMFVLQKPYKVGESAPFIMKKAGASMTLGGLEIESMELQEQIAQFDLTLTMVELASSPSISQKEGEKSGELLASFEYNTDLFHSDTIDRMSEHFKILLESIVQNPNQKVSQLPILTPAEHDRLVFYFNNTAAEYPQNKTVVDLFEEQAEENTGGKKANSIAVIFENNKLTYRQLNEYSNRIAHFLKDRFQIQPDDRVGLLLERSEQMIAGILGILKAGGAYVPMEPGYPEDRIRHIIADSGCKAILSTSNIIDKLKINAEFVDIHAIHGENTANPQHVLSPAQLAYVIYTSGSTGIPKGVAIEHSHLFDYVNTFINEFKINSHDRILQQNTITFDASVEEIYPALCTSGMIVISRNPKEFDAVFSDIVQYRITVASLSPVAVYYLNTRADELTSLRILISGGDILHPSYINNLYGKTVIYNTYGPTETTVCASYYKIESLRDPLPIGKPIANRHIYILDSYLNPMPTGVFGELCIGGKGVTRGYLNRQELNKEKIIPNPFKSGEYMFRTGDLGRWLPDGNIEFIGRNDDQVKIRGYRIELGEIENRLIQHNAVSRAAVVAKKFRGDMKELAAYFTAKQALSVEELRNHLKSSLPDYMIPSYFIMLEEFPTLQSGKIDRNTLPAPEDLRPQLGTEYVMPQTEAQHRIADVWSEVLQLKQVGIHDNFFDLGGHSLLMVQVHNRLKEIFNQKLTIVELFQYPTIQTLAEHLSRVSEEEKSSSGIERAELRQSRLSAREEQSRSRQRHRKK